MTNAAWVVGKLITEKLGSLGEESAQWTLSRSEKLLVTKESWGGNKALSLFTIRHTHNGVENGFAQNPADYEQRDTYYFVVPDADHGIRVYEDDRTDENWMLEEGNVDDLKEWLKTKETRFADQSQAATDPDRMQLQQLMHRI
jgi:hypothetical protein